MSDTGSNFPEVDKLPYEAARDELVNIVRALETGSAPLAETLQMWERGEALAARCQQILNAAEHKLTQTASATAPPAAGGE